MGRPPRDGPWALHAPAGAAGLLLYGLQPAACSLRPGWLHSRPRTPSLGLSLSNTADTTEVLFVGLQEDDCADAEPLGSSFLRWDILLNSFCFHWSPNTLLLFSLNTCFMSFYKNTFNYQKIQHLFTLLTAEYLCLPNRFPKESRTLLTHEIAEQN